MSSSVACSISSPVPRVAGLRPASLDDFSAISAVEAAAGLPAKSFSHWQGLWLDNPAFHQMAGWPIGWVLLDSSARIVGTIGNIPSFFHFAGRRFLAASACGWAVLPEFRAHSFRLLSAQLQQPGIDLHLTTTANEIASALYSRLGWSSPPVGLWDRSSVWLTGFSSLLPPVFVSGPQPDTLFHSASSSFLLSWAHSFDARFEDFWNLLLRHRPHTLLAARSRSALLWHYRHALENRRLHILTASTASSLAAFMIFERRDSQSRNLSRVLLVDFQSLLPNPPLCSAMFRFALQSFRRQHVQVLENPGCWIEQPGLLGAHCILHRKLRSCGYLYSTRNPCLQAALQSPAAWHPTLYDGDATL